MIRVYQLDPPLPRLEAIEVLHNRAQLQNAAWLNPSGDVGTIVADWSQRTFSLIEYHLRGLGYDDARLDGDPGRVSWKVFRRGGAA
jgi:hypothetical protein